MADSIQTPRDVGGYIRLLRRKRGVTGAALGKATSLSQSKISKIETGAMALKKAEIESILNILECPKLIRQRIMAVLAITDFAFPSKYRPAISQPGVIYEREARTKHYCSFVSGAIPALLQTSAYREALLNRWDVTAAELTQKMTDVLKRQDLLWDSGRFFHFIVQETALYTQPGTIQVQLAQLDRLARIVTPPRIKLGVIPLEAGLLPMDSYSFIIYDDCATTFTVAQSDLYSVDPQRIADHLRMFVELDMKACYDTEAQKLIQKAVHFLKFGKAVEANL